MLPEGNGSLTAHTSKSSLQNSPKLTFENFNFLMYRNTYDTLSKSLSSVFSTKIIIML
jgi:hypothetical protein